MEFEYDVQSVWLFLILEFDIFPTLILVHNQSSVSVLNLKCMRYKPDLHTPILSANKKNFQKNFKQNPKNSRRIGPKSVNSSHIFQNRRSHCIEARFCLSLLGEFKKSADKVDVCKSGYMQFIWDPYVIFQREYAPFCSKKWGKIRENHFINSCLNPVKFHLPEQLFVVFRTVLKISSILPLLGPNSNQIGQSFVKNQYMTGSTLKPPAVRPYWPSMHPLFS